MRKQKAPCKECKNKNGWLRSVTVVTLKGVCQELSDHGQSFRRAMCVKALDTSDTNTQLCFFAKLQTLSDLSAQRLQTKRPYSPNGFT